MSESNRMGSHYPISSHWYVACGAACSAMILAGLMISTLSCGGSGSGSTPPRAPTPTPQFTLSTASLSFPDTAAGTTSSTTAQATVASTGSANLHISSITDSDLTEFPGTTTCPMPGDLAPGLNCTITVQFAPSVAGAKSGQITVSTNAGNGTISLSGNAVTPTPIEVSVSPPSVAVAPSATQQFTATVTGTSNTAVTWGVNGIPGGNSTIGMISSGGLYSAPATAPSPNTVTVTATSTADATKSANVQVTVIAAQGLAITSLSSASPIPLTPLYISTSGLDTSATAAPLSVQFSNGAGFSVSEQPIRIASDGTVAAAVPLYVDQSSGQIGLGTVSVVIAQGNQSSAPMSLSIQNLPPLSTYGTQPGIISRAVLNFDAMLLGHRINQLQAFQALPGNTISTAQAQSTLNTVLNAVIKARQDVDQVSLDNSVVISNGYLPNGTAVQFDQASLDLMDRIYAVILSETIGTLSLPASSASQVRAPASTHHGHRSQRFSQQMIALFGRQTLLLAHPGVRATPQATSAGFQDLLDAMESWSSADEVVTGAQEVIKTKGTDWVTDLQAASSAVGSYVKTLPDTPATQANNQALGGLAALFSSIRTVVDCWVDDTVYVAASATGNKALVNTAIDDMNSIPDKWSTIASLGLAVMGDYEALAPTATTLGFAQTIYTQSQNLDAADATSVALPNEFPVPPIVDIQGIADVFGKVNVPTDQGIGAPLSGIQLSSDLKDVFTTIADPSGNYQLFVPLQDPWFDYANADVTIVDPISQSNLGSETIDLSSLTTAAPLQIPTLQGSGCNNIDFDDDDPDCD